MKNEREKINTTVAEIGRYDAAVLDMKAADFYAAGFAPGDIVTVEFPACVFTMPAGRAYSDVDNQKLILMEIQLDGRMLVTINNGDAFAGLYGIKTGDAVTITMKKKGGYLKEYELRSCTMSADREDYAADEIFANFRFVQAGNIQPGRLYRGMSPIDPADGRNRIADRLLSQTDVKTVINLDGDPHEHLEVYPDYEKSYYSHIGAAPVKICYSPKNPQFFAGMGSIIRAICEKEAPFMIHCRYGRDRTGNVCAVLEALCDASFEEITADYMLSYENIHHITYGSEKWEFHARLHVDGFFRELTGCDDPRQMAAAELKAAVEKVLMEKSGVTGEQLAAVYKKLCA